MSAIPARPSTLSIPCAGISLYPSHPQHPLSREVHVCDMNRRPLQCFRGEKSDACEWSCGKEGKSWFLCKAWLGNVMHTWPWLWQQHILPMLSGKNPAKPALLGSKVIPSFPLPITNLNSLLPAQRIERFSKKWEPASSRSWGKKPKPVVCA